MRLGGLSTPNVNTKIYFNRLSAFLRLQRCVFGTTNRRFCAGFIIAAVDITAFQSKAFPRKNTTVHIFFMLIHPSLIAHAGSLSYTVDIVTIILYKEAFIMAEAEIMSGVCGFHTTVRAEGKPGYKAALQISSECQHVSKLAEELNEVNVMSELFKKGESKIMAARCILPHITCPVPVGILKAIEVAADMALPKDVSITLRK